MGQECNISVIYGSFFYGETEEFALFAHPENIPYIFHSKNKKKYRNISKYTLVALQLESAAEAIFGASRYKKRRPGAHPGRRLESVSHHAVNVRTAHSWPGTTWSNRRVSTGVLRH